MGATVIGLASFQGVHLVVYAEWGVDRGATTQRLRGGMTNSNCKGSVGIGGSVPSGLQFCRDDRVPGGRVLRAGSQAANAICAIHRVGPRPAWD
jgi:hypothetical protein